jgi:uncharacterized protein YndB with AHSA1/START domain
VTIRKSIRVERPQAVSFKLFCEDIGRWWPKGPSFEGKNATDMVMETHVGGRFYQCYADGTEYQIGQVTAYQPPEIVAFTWRAPSWDVPTQVEVRFFAEGDATRVELEHSGWERASQARAFHKNYESGWERMLEIYRTHVSSL